VFACLIQTQIGLQGCVNLCASRILHNQENDSALETGKLVPAPG
jgi:hypothetical protein